MASVFMPTLGWMVGGFPYGCTLTYAHSMLDRDRISADEEPVHEEGRFKNGNTNSSSQKM